MLLPPTTPERQAQIDHAGRISKTSFVATLWSLFALAILSAFIRLGLRLRLQKKLSVDDYLIVFAVVLLIAHHTTLYIFSDTLYLVEAIAFEGLRPEPAEIQPLLYGAYWRTTTLCLSWSLICTIKLSFLIFFKQLIKDVSKHITRYYWATAGVVFVCWGVTMSQPFVLCPYFGDDLKKCFPDTPRAISISMNTLATVFDVLSDAMIISIPILVLRRSRMALKQQLTIYFFLCLSAAMIVVAIIRTAGAVYPSQRNAQDFDITWQAFWQHVESNLAVLMGSIMMMRSIFISARSERSRVSKEKSNKSPGQTASLSKSWFRTSRNQQIEDVVMLEEGHQLRRPSATSARSLLPKGGHSNAMLQPDPIPEDDSSSAFYDEYHDFRRQDMKSTQSLSQ